MSKRNKVFTGSLQQAFATYVKNDTQKLAGDFWDTEAIATAVENADNALKSLSVLRKHLPEHFHQRIRFSQPNITWYLNVEQSITANQLNMLLDDLLIRIAKDIGYAPRIKVSIQPSKHRWQHSGFPLSLIDSIAIAIPEEDEAQRIINEFIKS